MVARFHYDESVYQQLLSDDLPPSETEDVTRHIEQCTSCQDVLEAVSSSDDDWNNVRRFLRSDLPTTPDAVGPTVVEPATNEERLSFLSPSEEHESLGRFGRYEITEILGRGGMGVVMRGHDPAQDRQSAIKVLAPELATSASARQRFSREAKSAAAVVHEHVVPIQTVDEHNGLPYLVMPVIGGDSLQQRVNTKGPLEIKETLRIGLQVASGLAAAHAQGLVHRDVKPANILLENGVERVCITDFGLARAADDANMTRSGVIAGTPQYMSPEQARGNEVDYRSDLFSLGSVLYFMCTGRSPFRAETTMGVLNRICHDQPRSVRSVNSDVPVWLQEIINRLLTKKADDRFQSAEEVANVLEQWLAHLQQPETAPAPPSLHRSRKASGRNIKRWLTVAFGAAFFAFATVIILETSKGTIEIDAGELNDVPIKVMKGDRVYRRLTITPSNKSVRVTAGEYVVQLDGEQEGIEIKDGTVSVTFRGADEVKITTKQPGDSSDTPGASRAPLYIGVGPQNNEERLDFHGQPPETTNGHLAEGLWEMERAQQAGEGQEHPTTLSIHGGQFGLSWKGKPSLDSGTPLVRSAHMSIKGTRSGKIDLAFESPSRAHMTLRGAYEVTGESLKIAITAANNPGEWIGPLPLIWHFQRKQSDAGTIYDPASGEHSKPERRVIPGSNPTTASAWLRAIEEETRHPVARGELPEGEPPESNAFTKAEHAIELMNRLSGVWMTTGPNVRTGGQSPGRNSPVVKFKGQRCQIIIDNKQIVDGIYSLNMDQRPYTIYVASSPLRREQLVSLTGSLSLNDDCLVFTVKSTTNVQELDLPLVWRLFDSTSTKQQTIKGATLEEVAKNLEKEFNERFSDDKFAPTAEEFAATLRWNLLASRRKNEKPSELAIDVEQLLMTGKIPPGYKVELWVVDAYETASLVQVRLSSPDKGTAFLCERFMPKPKGLSPLPDETLSSNPEATPLAAAISGLSLHNDDWRLTEQEVIAAIRRWKSLRRSEAPVTNGEFAKFVEIAETRMLPPGFRFEVLTGFEPGDGYVYDRSSIRILMDRTVEQKKGWTFAFDVRERTLSAKLIDDGTIAWGEPAENGLQVGIQILPFRKKLEIESEVQTRFFFRNKSGEPMEFGVPRIMTHGYIVKLHSQTPEGDSIPCQLQAGPGGPVGWRTERLEPNDTIHLSGLSIKIGGNEDDASISVVNAKPGQSCELWFRLNNYPDDSGSFVDTGKLKFTVVEPIFDF